MKPGEIITCKEGGVISSMNILKPLLIKVSNLGDRPIQVGSHMHFFEVNRALEFDRKQARGFRLNVPAGTAARFEPVIPKKLNWLPLAGNVRCMGSII